VKVVVNGEPIEVASEATVSELLQRLGRSDGSGVAVAVNGEVVTRREWTSVRLAADDRVEVLGAVGGG
jgi:sulfur carrier protein